MNSAKPLGRKAYGSIGHLPGSRLGPGDKHVHVGQDAICTIKARDRHDRIIVTEKLDGSNTAVANIDGNIHALTRAGYLAHTSPYEQHHLFDRWVRSGVEFANALWLDMLQPGEVLHGEWLALAHGTKYKLEHEPFVAFDLTRNGKRVPHDELQDRCIAYAIRTAYVIHNGGPISVADAMTALGTFGHHGALEPAEGVVYRVERRGEIDFMAKFVRADKVDGKYLAEISGCEPHWHWRP